MPLCRLGCAHSGDLSVAAYQFARRGSVKHALAPVAALLIGVSILLTGQGLQGTLLPVRASIETFSTISIGIMGGAYFLGFTLGCLKGGELLRRVGHVRVFASMTALASAVPLIHGLVLEPFIWGVLRATTGFCFAILYIVIESWLNERATNANRGIVFSTYTMINLTVLAVGQMLLLLSDPRDMELFAVASILVSLAAIPVALSVSPSPELPQSTRIDVKRLLQISPVGAIACLATGLANGSFWALAPVFASGTTGNVTLAATFMTAAVIGGSVTQWPLGFASDRIGRRRVMLAISGIGALIGSIIAITADNASFVGLILLAAAWGGSAFPLYAIAVAHTNDYAESNEYVMVSAGLLLMYGIGAIVGPPIASVAMTLIGSSGLYLFTAAVHMSLVALAFVRMLRRKRAPQDERSDFGDALATAHTASQVYEEEIQQAHSE